MSEEPENRVLLAGGSEGFVEGRLHSGAFAGLTVGNHKHMSAAGNRVNQDGILVLESGGYTLLAVADGVTGRKPSDSHLASQYALYALAEINLAKTPPGDLNNAVGEALTQAAYRKMSGISTTLTAAFVYEENEKDFVKVYNVGDSHIGLLRANSDKFRFLTKIGAYSDRVPFQLNNRADTIRGLINTYLREGERKKANNKFVIKEGDMLFLTTDGLDKHVDRAMLWEEKEDFITPDEAYALLMKDRGPADAIRNTLRNSIPGPDSNGVLLDPDSLNLGGPNTRAFSDDIGAIVYSHGAK